MIGSIDRKHFFIATAAGLENLLKIAPLETPERLALMTSAHGVRIG